jgi:hypothetical protein
LVFAAALPLLLFSAGKPAGGGKAQVVLSDH